MMGTTTISDSVEFKDKVRLLLDNIKKRENISQLTILENNDKKCIIKGKLNNLALLGRNEPFELNIFYNSYESQIPKEESTTTSVVIIKDDKHALGSHGLDVIFNPDILIKNMEDIIRSHRLFELSRNLH